MKWWQPIDENLRKAGTLTTSSKRKLPSSLVIVPEINVESFLFIRTTFTKSRGVLFSSTTLPVIPCAKAEADARIKRAKFIKIFIVVWF